MVKVLELKAELRRVEPADLLMMAFNQKEHNCVLNPNGSCPCYFKYKGFGFCVSELSGQGCQAEKAGLSVDLSTPYHGETITISRAEVKNGNGKVLGVEKPDPFRNRISRFKTLSASSSSPCLGKGDSTGNGLGNS
jgi:hypothetical protein